MIQTKSVTFSILFMALTFAFGRPALATQAEWEIAAPAVPVRNDEIPLLDVTSDVNEDSAHFRAVSAGNGEISSFRFYVKKKDQADAEVQNISLDALAAGATLLKSPTGSPVIKLTSSQMQRHSGGGINLVVLREMGLFENDYRVLPLELVSQQGKWQLYSNGQAGFIPFDSLYIRGRFFLNIPKGVEIIETYSNGRKTDSFRTDSLSKP